MEGMRIKPPQYPEDDEPEDNNMYHPVGMVDFWRLLRPA